MVLRLGNSGDEVKTLQRGLNRLGELLLVDGDFGPATRDAVVEARTTLGLPGSPEADAAFQEAVSAVADPFPPLTAAGVTFIARAEVSTASDYRRKFRVPCWPSETSGITIGIGYDCQFVTPTQFRSDWGAVLEPGAIERLEVTLGKAGSADSLAHVREVVVPLGKAMSVFARRSLPHYLAQTRAIYPQVDDLDAAQRTALVSLVYNRGNSLKDRDSARQERREMRVIRDLLASGQPDLAAAQLDAMTRLWDAAELGGLAARRRTEAALYRSGFAALQLD